MSRSSGTISAELIGQAQAGDHLAIDTVLRLTQPDIRRYARRSCRMPDIDDAVQETLITVARRIDVLRSPLAFAGWVYVIVGRACRRLMRQLPLGTTTLESMHNSLELAARPDAELRFDLASAIQSLPEHYRTVILLRDIEELGIAEIATRTALTHEAVKARLHRARLMIREYLSA